MAIEYRTCKDITAWLTKHISNALWDKDKHSHRVQKLQPIWKGSEPLKYHRECNNGVSGNTESHSTFEPKWELPKQTNRVFDLTQQTVRTYMDAALPKMFTAPKGILLHKGGWGCHPTRPISMQTPLPGKDTTGYGQKAGGTHPTRMHPCFTMSSGRQFCCLCLTHH